MGKQSRDTAIMPSLTSGILANMIIRPLFSSSQIYRLQIGGNIHIDAIQPHGSALGGLAAVSVGQQHLLQAHSVSSSVQGDDGGLGAVGAPGQHDDHLEASPGGGGTGGIMKGGGIDLHHRAGGSRKAFTLAVSRRPSTMSSSLASRRIKSWVPMFSSLSRWYSRQLRRVLCPLHHPSWMGMPP